MCIIIILWKKNKKKNKKKAIAVYRWWPAATGATQTHTYTKKGKNNISNHNNNHWNAITCFSWDFSFFLHDCSCCCCYGCCFFFITVRFEFLFFLHFILHVCIFIRVVCVCKYLFLYYMFFSLLFSYTKWSFLVDSHDI